MGTTGLDKQVSKPRVRTVVVTFFLAAPALILLYLNVALVMERIRVAPEPSWEWLFLLVPLSGIAVAAYRGWNTRHFVYQPPWWRVATTSLLAMEALIFVFLVIGYGSAMTI